MFLELIATFVAGVGAAGMVLGLRWLSGGRLAKWLTPAAAAAAMLAMTIGLEYSWFDRTIATLPEGVEVAEVNETRQMYRPWTYAMPLVNRFMAVDVATMRSHDALPDQHIADIYLLGRWSPIKQFPVLVDCAGSRRAPLTGNAGFQADGSVSGTTWTRVPASDPVLETACRQG